MSSNIPTLPDGWKLIISSVQLHARAAVLWSVAFSRSSRAKNCRKESDFKVYPYYRCRMWWCLNSVFHLLCCVRLRICARRGRSRLPLRIREIWAYMRMLVQSLYFNSLTDSDVVFDSVFEPVFSTVEFVTRCFGTVFVCLVVSLTGSIMVVAYSIFLPLVLANYSPPWILWHICFGHWIIIMISFHYYKATRTSPGFLPSEKNDSPFVAVCKKCIMPKPARTHHCGICNRCILKMDHHCPWLNNCVGHFNHRYFFSFCLFAVMGCAYCTISGRKVFMEAYYALERIKHLDMDRPGVPVTGMGVLIGILPPGQTSDQTPAPLYTFKDKLMHKSIIYMWVLTSTVTVVLGALTLWHAVLISKGETSIERHTNSKETERMAKQGKVFRNPHNYGRLNNWKVFFGVEKRSHWVTRVLLPSGHPPPGDGMTWHSFPFKKDLIPV